MFGLFKRSDARSIERISPARAKELLAHTPGAALIDVRTPEEFRQRRIPGSRNIPLGELSDRAQAELPDQTQPLVLYCLSGARSAQASSLLAGMGYETIYDLGGINAWPYETARG